jgi:hypothetical protein
LEIKADTLIIEKVKREIQISLEKWLTLTHFNTRGQGPSNPEEVMITTAATWPNLTIHCLTNLTLVRDGLARKFKSSLKVSILLIFA